MSIQLFDTPEKVSTQYIVYSVRYSVPITFYHLNRIILTIVIFRFKSAIIYHQQHERDLKMNIRIASLLCVSTAIVLFGLDCSQLSTPVSYNKNVHTISKFGPQKSIVTTDWLYSKLDQGEYTIIDVRSEQEYSENHIPGAINIPFEVPYSVWITMVNGLLLEIPEITQLATQLGENGISIDNKVVLVTSLPTEANPFSLAAPTRVALTLAYAGLNTISILDGGFDKWATENKPVTTETTVVSPVDYMYEVDEDIFVEMDYVENKLGEVILIDARDAEIYDGTVICPFANAYGHIATAVSLPAQDLWTIEGTYKSKGQIHALANQLTGGNLNEEIIIYCGVGGYASAVWYALTKILNYSNVKVYDGSAQEWALTHDMVIYTHQ